MQAQQGVSSALAAAGVILGYATARAAENPDLNKVGPGNIGVGLAFDALKTYDFGVDLKVLEPIQEAVVAAHGDPAANKELEIRLAAVLKSEASRDAKDTCCRWLRIIGTAESVPALAGLLGEKDHSHMARYALQSIPAPEAGAALRESLGKLKGPLLIGVLGSLGCRRDAECVAALAALLNDDDKAVAAVAAHALGSIGNAQAGKALAESLGKGPEGEQLALADSALTCAEQLLASGEAGEAKHIYQSLSGASQPKHVRLAAARGLLAVAGKKG